MKSDDELNEKENKRIEINKDIFSTCVRIININAKTYVENCVDTLNVI